MLAKFKWLLALICFVVQYMVLSLLPGIEIYPDVALAAVCALGLIYGVGVGMFYGLCVGLLAGSLFTLSLSRTVLTYALIGFICGLLSFKARSSRFALPIISVGLSQIARQMVDVVYLMTQRTYFDTYTLIHRLWVSALLTIVCALPIYWLLYRDMYRYHVIGKRVGI